MATFNQIDLIVRDVPTAATFFRDVVGLTLRVNEERFAELESGTMTLMFGEYRIAPVDGSQCRGSTRPIRGE